jgi:SMI1-KNR4 cell-wall
MQEIKMVFFKGIEFVIQKELHPISEEEIILVESELNIRFPDDYRDFIMEFGEGEFCDIWIVALSPDRISREFLPETRERLSEFWFWNMYQDGFNQEKALNCIPFFNTSSGDDILFDPSKNNNWYILPHGREEIILIHSFQELFSFYVDMYNSFEVQPPFKFDPW